MSAGTAIFLPFMLTFALPGTAAAIFFLRRQTVDAVFFFLCAAAYGFGAQMAAAFGAHFFLPFAESPATRAVLASSALLAILGYACVRTFRNGSLPRITVSTYDVLTAAVAGMIALLLRGTMMGLPAEYFNPASDQYYWLAYANRSIHDFGTIFSFFLRDPVTQPLFFLTVSPYVAFLPKDIGAYQIFMEAWPYGAYVLSACAMARLAYEALPPASRAWGILAPLSFYLLHWSNYYAISTDVVPQNIGIFLFITGLVLLGRDIGGTAGIAYMTLFSFTHLATATMFVLAVGTAKIAVEGITVVAMRIRQRPYRIRWHAFEKIAVLPAAAAIVLYGLYGGRMLDYRPIETIGYADEYAKKLTLWDQPYMDTPQITVLRLAIAGLALAPLAAYTDPRRRRLIAALGAGFALPWIFLKTPLVAYHAFFASWQSFRYYLIMYPAISVLGLLPAALGTAYVRRFVSNNLAVGITACSLMLLMPVMLSSAAQQQELVALDMITGRDGGTAATTQKKTIAELTAINGSFPDGAVISAGKDVLTPYSQWVFSPRPWFIVFGACTERSCPAYDSFAHQEKEAWEIPSPGLGIIQKGTPHETDIRKIFEKLFGSMRETEAYFIYGNLRPA